MGLSNLLTYIIKHYSLYCYYKNYITHKKGKQNNQVYMLPTMILPSTNSEIHSISEVHKSNVSAVNITF